MQNKKKWSELTPTQQKLIIAGGAVELALTTAALISLAQAIQPFGPIAYFALGRRNPAV